MKAAGQFLLVFHCAVMGHWERPIRSFDTRLSQDSLDRPTVTVWFYEPRWQTPKGITLLADNGSYITIEQDQQVVYDSRQDVPCDMDAWLANRLKRAPGGQFSSLHGEQRRQAVACSCPVVAAAPWS